MLSTGHSIMSKNSFPGLTEVNNIDPLIILFKFLFLNEDIYNVFEKEIKLNHIPPS